MPVGVGDSRFRVAASPGTVSTALSDWSRDRRSGLSGPVGTGVVWWVSVTPSEFRARYERLRFFVEIRGQVTEIAPGQSELRISVGLEPLMWLLLIALAALFVAVGLFHVTRLDMVASSAALIVIALVGAATWIGAHEFVNSKLIPRLCGLGEQDRLMEG